MKNGTVKPTLEKIFIYMYNNYLFGENTGEPKKYENPKQIDKRKICFALFSSFKD